MIKVRELTASLSLGLQLIAGKKGEERQITWVHTVDLPDPWRWISPGNLVMTTGAGLPVTASHQTEWLEKLALSNASALVIARHPSAPEITPALLETADRLMFPVLETGFEQEFVKLSRAIIEGILQVQQGQYTAGEQLFQAYAKTLREDVDLDGRLRLLAASLKIDLEIEDALSGTIRFSSHPSTLSASPSALPMERVPLAGRSRTHLILYRTDANSLKDPLLVRSLTGLLEIELERLMIERDQQRREGSALLDSLLRGETSLALISPILQQRGLYGTLVCLALEPAEQGDWNADNIHHAPGLKGASLLIKHDERLLILCPDTPEIALAIRKGLGAKTVCGMSSPVNSATGLAESFRQARLACSQAKELHKSVLRYGEADTGLAVYPTSLSAARAIVDRYLSPLIEHDRHSDANLLVTLVKFLENDGSWKSTSYELHIHRQTLVYRLKLITKLTGLSPTSTAGTALLWLALEAGRSTKLLP
ncbi:PucR family transcriptional regulator [Pantoea rwandensis]|uniref:PucR family transcriptional regulator n=1 Tax=Pantoea rwandensis TaxID=1076550 RepID=A0A1X1D5Z0_9GAMM|nr:PucR family transcriptional regulator [Pantoea rwandensis]ORM72112.1 PucR family transcriptional regulator [Pantoea rwandensis]